MPASSRCIDVRYNLIDPIERNYAEFLAQQLSAEINQRIITRAVQEGQDRGAPGGAGRVADPARRSSRNRPASRL